MKNVDRLKVLMLTTSYPSDHRPTSGVFFREHARAVSLYDDVTVMCSYSYSVRGSRMWKSFKIKDNNENGVRTIRLEFPKISDKVDAILSFLLVLYAGLKIKKYSHFDVIHAQKFFPIGVLGVILGKIYKTLVVISEHSSNFAHAIRSFIRKLSIKYAMKKARGIIAVSRALSNSIKTYNPKLNIKIVPNPVNINEFLQNDSEIFNHPVKKILHVSSLNNNKGINYLIEAIHKLRGKRDDFIVNIIGGSSENIMKFQELVKAYQLNEFIIFHGKKNHDDIVNHMRDCNFFVLPSIRESFGVVLIEAMACGKPVIATICGGPEEIVTKDIGVLIRHSDVEALAQALNYMLDNFKNFNPKYIVQYVKDNFSYEVVGKAIDQVYRECLQSI